MQTTNQLEAQMQALSKEINSHEKNIKTLRGEILNIKTTIDDLKLQRADVYRTICAQRVPKVKNSTGMPGRPKKAELSEATKYQYGLMANRLAKQKEQQHSNIIQSVAIEREAVFMPFFRQGQQAIDWFAQFAKILHQSNLTEEQKLAKILEGGYHIHLAPMARLVKFEAQFITPNDTEKVRKLFLPLNHYYVNNNLQKWLNELVPNHKHLVEMTLTPEVVSSTLNLPEFPTPPIDEPQLLRPWETASLPTTPSQPWLNQTNEPSNATPAPPYVESTRQRLRHTDPEIREQTISERSLCYNVLGQFNPDIEPVDDAGNRIKPHHDAY